MQHPSNYKAVSKERYIKKGIGQLEDNFYADSASGAKQNIEVHSRFKDTCGSWEDNN